MKKMSLLSILTIACTSSGSNSREDSALPTFLPGIPRSVTKHCAETSKAIADVAPELTEHPACEGMAANLQAMQAAVAIGGRIGNEWERFDARPPTVCN